MMDKYDWLVVIQLMTLGWGVGALFGNTWSSVGMLVLTIAAIFGAWYLICYRRRGNETVSNGE